MIQDLLKQLSSNSIHESDVWNLILSNKDWKLVPLIVGVWLSIDYHCKCNDLIKQVYDEAFLNVVDLSYYLSLISDVKLDTERFSKQANKVMDIVKDVDKLTSHLNLKGKDIGEAFSLIADTLKNTKLSLSDDLSLD